MNLNDGQAKACDLLAEWWKGDPRKTPFRIDGYAGTGKTTVVQYMLRQLGLPADKIRLLAPTGKAARVLERRTGLSCSTIHRELYRPIEPQEVESIRKEIEATPPGDRERLRALRTELAEAERDNEIGFDGKAVDTENVLLYVVDEVSMVSVRQAKDLLDLRVPLILLGDPGQLPPVKEKPGFAETPAAVTLTEIMRQDEGSAILEAANIVRRGGELPFENWGAFRRAPRKVLTDADYAEFDVVLCGTHKWRMAYNRRLRAATHGEDLPPIPIPGDKLVCRKNDYGAGIMNGQLLRAESKAKAIDDTRVTLKVSDEDGGEHPAQLVSSLRFLAHYDKTVPVHNVFGALEADYAYALTVHSAQGSEWSSVAVLNDWPGRDHERWLYTALTRGADRVVLVG